MSPIKTPAKSGAPSARSATPRDAATAKGRPSRTVTDLSTHLEAKRAQQERSKGHKHLRRLILLVVVGILAVGAWLVLHSALFSARVVRIEGNITPAQRSAVLDASGLRAAPPLIALNPGAVSARVEGLAWVGAVRVSRQWPDGVTVVVHGRAPVGVVQVPGQGVAEVDRTGRVLALSATAPPGLVSLHVPVQPGRVGTWLAPSAHPALRVAASLPPALKGLVAAVVALPHGAVELQLTSPLTVYLGQAVELHQKYEDAASVLAAATFTPGEVIDVSVPRSPQVGTAPPG